MPKIPWEKKPLDERVKDAHRAYRTALNMLQNGKINLVMFNDITVGYVLLLEEALSLTEPVTKASLKEHPNANA